MIFSLKLVGNFDKKQGWKLGFFLSNSNKSLINLIIWKKKSKFSRLVKSSLSLTWQGMYISARVGYKLMKLFEWREPKRLIQIVNDSFLILWSVMKENKINFCILLRIHHFFPANESLSLLVFLLVRIIFYFSQDVCFLLDFFGNIFLTYGSLTSYMPI